MSSMNEVQKLTWVRRACRDGEARRRRQSSGLSLTEVGDALGASPGTVQQWESGIRRPRTAAALRYADLLLALEDAGPNAPAA
jgi:transcriptional regulator with XRE-family HTH domain